MAFERETHFVRVHAAAVVADFDQLEAAGVETHGELRRAGVE